MIGDIAPTSPDHASRDRMQPPGREPCSRLVRNGLLRDTRAGNKCKQHQKFSGRRERAVSASDRANCGEHVISNWKRTGHVEYYVIRPAESGIWTRLAALRQKLEIQQCMLGQTRQGAPDLALVRVSGEGKSGAKSCRHEAEGDDLGKAKPGERPCSHSTRRCSMTGWRLSQSIKNGRQLFHRCPV
jgi:hypothetical protein